MKTSSPFRCPFDAFFLIIDPGEVPMKTRNLRSLTLQLAISQKRKSQYGNCHYRLVYFKSTITNCRLPYCHKCTLKKHPRQTQISPGRHKAPTRIHPQRGDLTTSRLSKAKENNMPPLGPALAPLRIVPHMASGDPSFDYGAFRHSNLGEIHPAACTESVSSRE